MERSRYPRSRGRGRGSHYRRKKPARSVSVPVETPCLTSDQTIDSRETGRKISLSPGPQCGKTPNKGRVSDINTIRINPPAQLQRRLEFMRTTGLGHVIMSNAPITRSMVSSQNLVNESCPGGDKETDKCSSVKIDSSEKESQNPKLGNLTEFSSKQNSIDSPKLNADIEKLENAEKLGTVGKTDKLGEAETIAPELIPSRSETSDTNSKSTDTAHMTELKAKENPMSQSGSSPPPARL